MITKIELNKDGERVRVYHRAGLTEQGPDTRFVWTHPMIDRQTCEACLTGRIPGDVQRGPK